MWGTFSTCLNSLGTLKTCPTFRGQRMLQVFAGRYQSCDGISRRNFLGLGASFLGLGLADVLRLRAAAEARQSTGKSNKSLIVLWTHGGMSQQVTYDLKPDAPA